MKINQTNPPTTITANAEAAKITMITEKSGDIIIYMAGSGEAIIDWGDGTDNETYMLKTESDGWNSDSKYSYMHSYSSVATHIITITGEHVTHLECCSNNLTSLDVSKNATLKDLYCSYNQLTSLDVSKNDELTWLYCYYNQFTSLDMSKNAKLTNLGCSDNQLANLDISKNTALRVLWCDGNQLKNLDVSKNTVLAYLYCAHNKLGSFDVSENIKLIDLGCNNNLLMVDALNNLFETLHNHSEIKSINIKGNPGATAPDLNISIAEAKGWTVSK